MYVVKKGYLYVSKPGQASAYTPFLRKAMIFSTKEAAERNRCVENETVVPLKGEFYGN